MGSQSSSGPRGRKREEHGEDAYEEASLPEETSEFLTKIEATKTNEGQNPQLSARSP